MKLHEIVDKTAIIKKMADWTVKHSDEEDLSIDIAMEMVSVNSDGSVNVSWIPGGSDRIGFTGEYRLNPPAPISVMDGVVFSGGSFTNIEKAIPVTVDGIVFEYITDIPAEKLVNHLTQRKGPHHVGFHRCTFVDNNIVPLITLANGVSMPDQDFMLVTDGIETAESERLEQLFRHAARKKTDEFDFQEMLIDAGFEEFV